MPTLSHGLSWIDLSFLGRPRAIAAAIVHGAGGAALVDPGPTTCLQTLARELAGFGLSFADVRQILLTHIHLDHAGSVGTIVRAHPHIRVHVHQRGAPHLTDPGRLVDSVRRVYGDQMNRLWGEVVRVPKANVVALEGGERVEAGGRTFEVAYTPGHAAHHVSYLDAGSGVAFVGDTAGVVVDGGYVLPPTPPPDVDLDLWRASAARIVGWAPDTLFLTHFGPVTDVGPHLQTVIERLDQFGAWVRRDLDDPGSDEDRRRRFVDRLRRELRRCLSAEQIAAFSVAVPLEQMWVGLARYWRTRGIGDQLATANG